MHQLDVSYGSAGFRCTAMIAGGSATRQAELAALARLSGCRPLSYDNQQAADYLLVDLSSETESAADSLFEIVLYLANHRSIALVWTELDDLEDAYAALPSGRCHFLVDAKDMEALPILAGAFGRGVMDRLHERDRHVEFGSLHRISDELAEFARALARMADTDRQSGVSDKPVSFRPAALGSFPPFAAGASEAKDNGDAKAIREIIKLRRLRDRFFDSELFADPAWDILLDLHAAMLEGQKVSVSSLCIAAAVPPTTALRWITAMTESGLLIRRQDPNDARRVFIELSDESSAKLADYFASTAFRTRNII